MTKADSPAKPPPKRLETITLKVFIHCEGCRRKVRRIIRVLDGVEDVTVDPANGKVTVTGTVDAKTILQRLQKYGKHAEMWPTSGPTSAPILAPPAPTASTGKAGTNQPKPHENNNNSQSNSKKKGNGGAEGGDKGGDKSTAPASENGSKKGDGKEVTSPGTPAKGGAGDKTKPESNREVKPEEVSNASPPAQNGGGGGGGGGGNKKGGKKGGNGNNTSNNGNNSNNSGGGNANAPEVALPPPRIHDIPIMGPPNTSIEVSANRSLAPYDSVQTGYTYHSAEYATHMFSDENANNCSIM